MTDKPTTRFKPGQSGNPTGRPKVVSEIRALAREHTEPAIQSLVDIMRNSPSDSARVAAIKELLDRGYGKAPQALTGPDGEGPVELSLKIEFISAKAH